MENVLSSNSVPGCFPCGKYLAYVHSLVADSRNAEYTFERTVFIELNEVSRNIACAWILNVSVGVSYLF